MISILATLFILIFAVGLIHFVYDGILLPSWRCKYRYDLFALRDELRLLKAENPEISDEAFEFVQDGINTCIRYLHAVNVLEAVRARKKMAADPELVAALRHTATVINTCPVKRVSAIDDEAIEILAKVVLLNSAGMILYVVPVIMMLISYDSTKRRVAQFAKVILSAPAEDRDRFIAPIPA